MKNKLIIFSYCALLALIFSGVSSAMDLRNIRRAGIKSDASGTHKRNFLFKRANSNTKIHWPPLFNSSEIMKAEGKKNEALTTPQTFFQKMSAGAKSALSSTLTTVKSDLGLGTQTKKGAAYSLTQDLCTAGRLYTYSYLTTVALNSAMSLIKTTDTNSVPKLQQYASPQERPSLVAAIIMAPFLEEILFTYSVDVLPHPALSIVNSILFGALHYHPDRITWAYLGLVTGTTHYMRMRNFQARDKALSLVPILAHMFNNAASRLVVAITDYKK